VRIASQLIQELENKIVRKLSRTRRWVDNIKNGSKKDRMGCCGLD
jgi:hypothetical protein